MKKIIFIFAILSLPSFLFSQWSNDPAVNNVVTNSTTNDRSIVSCPDGAGGIIVAWQSNSTIRAQRINAFGQMVWTTDGVHVSADTGTHTTPVITSDGAGGAIIAWIKNELEPFEIYAQRVRNDGICLWTSGGVKVNAGSLRSPDPWGFKITSVESGASIITWLESPVGIVNYLYSQKLDAYGARLWATGDLQISFDITYYYYGICKDGKNGVYIVYSNSQQLFAQHVNAAGDTLWNVGYSIISSPSAPTAPSICEDQNYGFIVSWVDYRNVSTTGTGIYAARFDSTGNNLWGTNGNLICEHTFAKLPIPCISDAHGGAHILWIDRRYGNNDLGDVIEAQNVDYNGQTRWTSNGKRIAKAIDRFMTADDKYKPQIAGLDALGGLIVTWVGYYGPDFDQMAVFAQKVDYYGAIQWDTSGVFVSTGMGRSNITLINDGGSGGCNIAWVDSRNYAANNFDIYAQHVKSNSNLGNRPGSNSSLAPLTSHIKQNYPNPFNPVTNISFDISESGFVSLKIYDMTGREVAILANGVYNPGQYSVTWDASNFATGAYFCKFIMNEKTEIKTMMLIK